MAKSLFSSFISAAAMSADRAVKQAAKERERQAKQAAKEHEKQDKIAEKERLQKEKQLDKLRNYSINVNGGTYRRNLLENPVTDAELNESKRLLDEAREKNKQWGKCFRHIGELSAKGNDLEKSGQISLAIKAYEAAIEYGEATSELNFPNYARDIDRLIILYRKQKDYQSEIDVLQRALANDMHPNYRLKYEQRLDKARELSNKQK